MVIINKSRYSYLLNLVEVAYWIFNNPNIEEEKSEEEKSEDDWAWRHSNLLAIASQHQLISMKIWTMCP